MAVEWITSSATETEISIFTDSLSSAAALQAKKSNARPKQLSTIIEQIGKAKQKISIIWIPSHTEIKPNEKVDQIAKTGLNNPQTEIHNEAEQEKLLSQIDNFILGKWQKHHDNSLTGKHQKEIVPIVSTKVKYFNTNRKAETEITRLRLGKCRLNKYLKDINKHPDGLCEKCRQPETIEHFLTQCTQSRLPTELKATCQSKKISFNLKEILSNNITINVVSSHLTKTKRNI